MSEKKIVEIKTRENKTIWYSVVDVEKSKIDKHDVVLFSTTNLGWAEAYIKVYGLGVIK